MLGTGVVLLQEASWWQHETRCKRDGRCPYSGMLIPQCHAEVCDCFGDPFDMRLHPEYFIVGGAP